MKKQLTIMAWAALPICSVAQSDTYSTHQIQIATTDSLQLTLPEVMMQGE